MNIPEMTDEQIEALEALCVDAVDASGWGFFNRNKFARRILAARDAQYAVMAGQEAVQPPQALEALKAAFATDAGYAWTWHCAAWACAHDEGLETGAANRAAARFMYMAFDVDTSKSPNFKPEHRAAQERAEPVAPAFQGREQFETWLRARWTDGYACPRKANGDYEDIGAQTAWEAWRDSRALLSATPPAPAQPANEAPANTTFKRDEWGALSPEAQKVMRDALSARTLKTAQGAASIRDVPLFTQARPQSDALNACKAACERVIEQDGGILGGIDFHALLKSVNADLSAAPSRVEMTDAQILDLWDQHTVLAFGKIGISPVVFSRKLIAALATKPQADGGTS